MIVVDPGPSTVAPHPLPVRLAEFGLGKLDPAESAPIAEHISSCLACRSVVEAVADDSLAGLFRRANHREPDSDDHNGRAADDASLAGSPSGYEVLEILGQGGMGVVSKARQVGLGRFVALKQLRPEVLEGRDGVARFRREAEAVARLRHPNIVPIYDVGWRGDLPYFSMEFVEGGTLGQRLATGPIEPATAATLVETLARAVQHAHDSGVVHRDLKPSNILLAPDLDHPKIGDFGLAKLDNDGNRTGSGAILGTPNYMAPEQAGGDSSKVGPSADIYALGAILYEALTGHPPFQGATILETLEMVRSAEPSSPRQFLGEIPRDLETIVLKCLEKQPDRRYTSARALADDLRRYLDGQPIVARPVSTPERLAKWARRRPWQAISLVLGAVLLCGAFAGTLVHNSRLRAEVARTEREAEEARTQRSRAEVQYRSARTAIRQMIDRLEDPRFKLPDQLSFRRQLLEDALTFYDGATRDDASADPSARLDKVDALLESSYFQMLINRPDDAVRSSRRALDLLQSLEAEGLAGADLTLRALSSLNKLGLALSDIGRLEDAIQAHTRAIERAEREASETANPNDSVAWSHHNFGTTLLKASRIDEAEPHFRKAVTNRRALLVSQSTNIELPGRLAESLMNLAFTHTLEGKNDQAEVEFAEAERLLQPIIRDHPEIPWLGLSLAALELNWGHMSLRTGRIERAMVQFRTGLATAEAVLRDRPDWPEARYRASSLAAGIAYAFVLSDRHRESIPFWNRAIELSDGQARKANRVSRLSILARDGNGSQALNEALALAQESPMGGAIDYYNLACVAAVAAGTARAVGEATLAESAARRAVGWLKDAHARGCFAQSTMADSLVYGQDSDLKALWGRDDFRRFRNEVAFPPDPFRPGR